MSRQTIIKGTLILTAAGIITRLLGFINKIYLTNTIGFTEIGIYQLIFPLYILAISICSTGLSSSISKHVAWNLSIGNIKEARFTLRKCICYGLLVSLLIILFTYCFSSPISIYILKNSNCSKMLNLIVLALPFVVIKSCINAFFIASDMPAIQGTTLLIEQVSRLLSIFIFCNSMDNRNAILAVYSTIVGEIISGFVSIILYFSNIKKIESVSPVKTVNFNKDAECKSLIKDIVYLTTNSTIFTLFSSFEAILLPAKFYMYYGSSEYALSLYGIITGIVLPFILFPSTITASMSTMLLPSISGDRAKNNTSNIRDTIIKSSIFSISLGIFSAILYFLLGEQLCILIFDNLDAGNILRKMCLLCPFIYLSSTLSSITNGLDKTLNNLTFNIISISIRIIFIFLLIPYYGVEVYIMSMFISYFVLIICYFMTLKKLLPKMQ